MMVLMSFAATVVLVFCGWSERFNGFSSVVMELCHGAVDSTKRMMTKNNRGQLTIILMWNTEFLPAAVTR